MTVGVAIGGIVLEMSNGGVKEGGGVGVGKFVCGDREDKVIEGEDGVVLYSEERGVRSEMGDNWLCRAWSSGTEKRSKSEMSPACSSAARISSRRVRYGVGRNECGVSVDCEEILKT